ncbi:hypothetical protein E4U19_007173 [Claviceps sp. Clav32 group G5]|nr:hypothetical protein E4U19_007173 [Claviceps sp. Clav32 group G5]
MTSTRSDFLFILNSDEFTRQMPMPREPVTQNHVTQIGALPDAGHNAPPQSRNDDSVGGVWPHPHSVRNQLAPNPPADLSTTPAIRSRPSEAGTVHYWSKVLGVNLEEHKSEGTKKAQERRNQNARATRRYRDKIRAEVKAEASRKEQEMKQELDEERERRLAAEEIARQKEEIARQKEEIARQITLQKDAEIERLRRENEELKRRR